MTDEAVLPDPELEPSAVVEALLRALQRGADTGATVLWSFAAPRMRGQLGEREALARALRGPLYGPLVGHAEARPGAMQRLDGAARLELEVVGEGGESARYLLSLARQRAGEAAGCWLVTGLRRELE